MENFHNSMLSRVSNNYRKKNWTIILSWKLYSFFQKCLKFRKTKSSEIGKIVRKLFIVWNVFCLPLPTSASMRGVFVFVSESCGHLVHRKSCSRVFFSPAPLRVPLPVEESHPAPSVSHGRRTMSITISQEIMSALIAASWKANTDPVSAGFFTQMAPRSASRNDRPAAHQHRQQCCRMTSIVVY